LAETIYGDTALRQSGDIDLLIHPDDLKLVPDAVAGLGYTPHVALSDDEEEAYLKSGYEWLSTLQEEICSNFIGLFRRRFTLWTWIWRGHSAGHRTSGKSYVFRDRCFLFIDW